MKLVTAITFIIALAGASSAIAQSAEEKRLEFYSDKLLVELRAVAEAQDSGESRAILTHRNALATITERWITAAKGNGLDLDGSEAFFREYFAVNYQGRIPADFANDIGLVSLNSLRAGLGRPPLVEEDDNSFLQILRDAGNSN